MIRDDSSIQAEKVTALVEALKRLKDYLEEDGVECYCDEMGTCGLCEAATALEGL